MFNYKAMRGTIESNASGEISIWPQIDWFCIAQVTLYSGAMGVVISQGRYPRGENYELEVLKKLFSELDLRGEPINQMRSKPSDLFQLLQEQSARLLRR